MFIKFLARLFPAFSLLLTGAVNLKGLIEAHGLYPKIINKRKRNIAHLKHTIGHIRIGAMRPIHIAEPVHDIG